MNVIKCFLIVCMVVCMYVCQILNIDFLVDDALEMVIFLSSGV